MANFKKAASERRARSHYATFAVGGAIAVQVLPLCLSFQMPTARGAWCWQASPPKCIAPDVSGGSCEEGAEIPPGGACTPVCANGKVPSGACEVLCPISQDPATDSTCFGDLNRKWWNFCQFGDKCMGGGLKLGTSETSEFGTFDCVEDTGKVGCVVVARTPESEDVGPKWDAGTVGLAVSLVALALAASAVGRMLPGRMSLGKALFNPRLPMSWTLANAIGVSLVLLGLVAYAIGLGADATSIEMVYIMGLAAGLVSSLPLWWAFFRFGAHSLLKMSREAAWRIHIAFGWFTLIFGTVHAIFVFVAEKQVFDNTFWTLALVGLILMWLGVLPAALQSFGVISYDKWKVLHFASMLGYLLVVVHLIDNYKDGSEKETLRTAVVLVMNVSAVVGFVAQKVLVKLTAKRATVVGKPEVTNDSGGQHVFLKLHAPGFAPAPGQWAYVSIPSISPVPHPFTVVPGDSQGHVRFFMKVTGSFTSQVAKLSQSSADFPKVSLEGPFGEPPIPTTSADAAVFVLGGVGVTPGLSLVAEAKKLFGSKVYIYWALRSPALLERCAPLLEPHIDSTHSCVTIKGCGTGAALPLGAREGGADIGTWIATVDSELAAAGAKTVLLFVCGPPGLSDAAKQAANQRRLDGVSWQIHVEEFLFLPKPPKLPSFGSSQTDKPNSVQASAIGARSS